ncbi:AIM24 family protein [Nesterenkonia sp. CL21]|uniref:AIM24 family protein n=1 Tax=Nesterenkonia sp. CL21 TaxID=3064894 RepID=UPI002879EE7D|nr:AIM24 family protein [Nesterenkonia sp. CL21]MDS2172638.1 AIM24 family protein [Nesterenkonia sp. CL21]
MTDPDPPTIPQLRALSHDTDRALCPAAQHILGVRVTPEHPVLVSRRRILAQRGALTLHHEQQDIDADLRRQLKDKGWGRSARDRRFRRRLARSIDIDVAGGLTLTGNLKTHTASGDGMLWLGRRGGDISLFELQEATLVVLSPQEVLAHDAGLTSSLEEAIPLSMAAVRDTTFAWLIRGSGTLATATPGETVVVEVHEDEPLRVEGDALLAFTQGIDISVPEDYTRQTTIRGVKWLLQFIPRLNLRPEPEPVWLTLSGAGHVIVRARD